MAEQGMLWWMTSDAQAQPWAAWGRRAGRLIDVRSESWPKASLIVVSDRDATVSSPAVETEYEDAADGGATGYKLRDDSLRLPWAVYSGPGVYTACPRRIEPAPCRAVDARSADFAGAVDRLPAVERSVVQAVPLVHAALRSPASATRCPLELTLPLQRDQRRSLLLVDTPKNANHSSSFTRSELALPGERSRGRQLEIDAPSSGHGEKRLAGLCEV